LSLRHSQPFLEIMEAGDDDSDMYDNTANGVNGTVLLGRKRFPVHDCCQFGSVASLLVRL
jgi:hypothetical protein